MYAPHPMIQGRQYTHVQLAIRLGISPEASQKRYTAILRKKTTVTWADMEGPQRRLQARTERDRDITFLASIGLSNQEIADKVGVSIRRIQQIRAKELKRV